MRNPVFIGRIVAAIAGCMVFAATPVTAQPKPAQQETPKAKPANIDKNGLLILVRGTLTALDQANKTGNYSTFRDLGAPSFMVSNDPTKLSEIFTNLRKGGVDLSGVMVQEPVVTALETLNNGMLHIVGFFPSGIGRLNFEMLYEPLNGQWRLFGISATTGPSSPAAPPPAPSQPAPSQKK